MWIVWLWCVFKGDNLHVFGGASVWVCQNMRYVKFFVMMTCSFKCHILILRSLIKLMLISNFTKLLKSSNLISLSWLMLWVCSRCQLAESSYQTFQCWLLCLFCHRPHCMELPSPSSPKETLSGLVRIQPQNFFSSKTIDMPCFLLSRCCFPPPFKPLFLILKVYSCADTCVRASVHVCT